MKCHSVISTANLEMPLIKRDGVALHGGGMGLLGSAEPGKRLGSASSSL